MNFADVYGRSLSKTLNGTNHIITTLNMDLAARSVNQSKLEGLEFSFDKRGDKISISLNGSSSDDASSTSKRNIWSTYYRNIANYLQPDARSNDSSVIISRVLSLTIDELENPLNRPLSVSVTLQHNEEAYIAYERTCSFWNFADGTGKWDSTNCTRISTNRTHTVCSCSHLTNFAILMSRNPSASEALSTLSIVGCSISVAALILTVIIYAVNWKQWKSDQAAVLLNLCVALIIANTIFLAGADKTRDRDGCIAVAVLLHYFFLAAFFLMLAEGVELLLYLIFVFHVRRKIETASLIAIAWGFPLIIVVTSILVAGKDKYISERNVCWLSVENGLIWTFVVPAFCITLINFLILAIILRRISKARFAATEFEKKRRLRATLWNISVICPMLGVSWAFGVLSMSFEHKVFQYIFVIANSLQGMLIFLFHAVLRNKKISEMFCKPKKPKRKPVAVVQTNPKPKEEKQEKEEEKQEKEEKEEEKEEKKHVVMEEEKKKGGVFQLVKFFQHLEKSGEFDSSQSFSTTFTMSTGDQSQTDDPEVIVSAEGQSGSEVIVSAEGQSGSEVIVTAEGQSGSDALPSSSDLDGVVGAELPTILEE